MLFARAIHVCSLSITTPGSLLANEFDVQSVLHGQVNLTAVNQIYVIHEAINSCKNLKIHCFENVNKQSKDACQSNIKLAVGIWLTQFYQFR